MFRASKLELKQPENYEPVRTILVLSNEEDIIAERSNRT
jgi:hypothetical protein